MDKELIGQILGGIAVILGFLSYQVKTSRKLLIMQTAVCVTFSLHYLLIGAISGFALNSVGIIRNLVYANRDKKVFKGNAVPVIFAIIMGTIGVLTWQNIASLLIVLGLVINTACLSFKNPQNIRKSILVSSPLVLIYDIIEKSMGGTIYESTVIISSIIGILHYRKKDKKYKMITCDLDGTLLSGDLALSEENKKAISEFKKLGIPFVPCTGRTRGEFPEVADNPDFRYLIYSNGAAIFDKETGEYILNGFSDETKKRIFEVALMHNAFPLVHADSRAVIDGKLNSKEYPLNDTVKDIVRKCTISLENFGKEILEFPNMECVSIFFKNEEDCRACREELLKDESLMVAEGWYCNIEVFSKNAGKSSAVKILAEKLGIGIEDVISIGDSDNDLLAVKNAGLGISVSNGTEELKAAADEVGCSNNEHIAQYVLNKYFK